MAIFKECPKCRKRVAAKRRRCGCGADLTGGIRAWWVDVQVNGKRIRRRVKRHDEAARLEKLLKASKPQGSCHHNVTFEKFISDYLAYCTTINKSVVHKEMRWRLHISRFFAKRKLAEVTRQDVEIYRIRRLEEGASPSTINREVAQIKHMLSVAETWGLIKRNPIKGMKDLKENDDRWRYLTREEFERLRAVISPHYTDLLTFLTYTGIRLGDVLALRWRDVDLDKGIVVIRGSQTKGGKTYSVPLHEEVLAVLRKRAEQRKSKEDRIFPHSGPSFRKAFKRALRLAGLPTTIRIHDLRHTFASWLALGGVPLQQIQLLLGHKDFQTTLRYAHLNPSVLRGAIEKI